MPGTFGDVRRDQKESVIAAGAAATRSGAQTVDGVAVTVTSPPQEVLVLNGDGTDGFYQVNTGAWTRRRDSVSAAMLTPGFVVYVEQGTANGGQTLQYQGTTNLTPGTDAWTMVSVGVVLPGTSTDNAAVRWDGTNGDTLQNSEVLIADGDTTGTMTLQPATAATAGSITFMEDTSNGTNTVTVIASADLGANRTLTLPDDTGTVVQAGAALTDNRLMRGDVAAADEFGVQNTGITADDSDNVSGVGTLGTSGAITVGTTTQLTPESAAGPGTLVLAADTDDGAFGITLTPPAATGAARVLTLPDDTGTVVQAGAAISDNVLMRGDVAAADEFGIQDTGVTVDDSDNASGFGTIGATGTITSTSATSFVGGAASTTRGSVRLLNANNAFTVDVVPPGTPGASRTATLPDGDYTLVGTSGLGATDNRLMRTDGTTGEVAQGTGITVDDSDNLSGIGTLTTTGDLTVGGDLVVRGDTTQIDSETVLIADNHLYLNQDYTTAVAQTGGLAVNYLPTATADTAAAGGFATTSTLATTGAATFSALDFIQISGADDPDNDGIYEVTSHAANVLTIDTTPVHAFCGTAFVVDASDTSAVITKVTIALLQTGTDGLWETAAGADSTTLTGDIGNLYKVGGADVANTDGGTGVDSSAFTGVAKVAAGTWSASAIDAGDLGVSAAVASGASEGAPSFYHEVSIAGGANGDVDVAPNDNVKVIGFKFYQTGAAGTAPTLQLKDDDGNAITNAVAINGGAASIYQPDTMTIANWDETGNIEVETRSGGADFPAGTLLIECLRIA
jgi:hypothetical protein